MKTAGLIITAVFSWACYVLAGTGVPLALNQEEAEVQFQAVTQRAFEQEAAADFVAWYSTDGKLDIGVGRTDKKGIHHSIRFSLGELESFFDKQKHKQWIVVGIDKHVWSDEILQKHVMRLKEYFVARGYKKVVIQEGLGLGRGILLEHEAKPMP